MSLHTQSRGPKRPLSAAEKHEWSRRNIVQATAEYARETNDLTPNEHQLLKRMAKAANLRPDGQMICTTEVNELCEKIMISRMTHHRALTGLANKGFVFIKTGAQGKRGVFNGHWLGVDVSPSLVLADEAHQKWLAQEYASRERTDLKRSIDPLKGSIKRKLQQIGETAGAIWKRGVDFLKSLPKRYDAATNEELAQIAQTARIILEQLCAAADKAISDARVTSVIHPCHTDDGHNTNTQKNIYKSNTGEHREAETAPRKAPEKKENESDGWTLEDAIKILTPRDMTLMQECYEMALPQQNGHQALLDAYEQVALSKWLNLGGDRRTFHILTKQFGQLERSVLLLLFADRLVNENLAPVQNLHGYTMSCVKKCLKGTFNWSAGIKSAARRVEAVT